ncbi:NAD(P)H-hydrate dehydratase [Microbacterium caowuchunii]|uniref:ADP-dependent NAD(P)H-hydrate dehydratase n=1 Tax=Microbacterium caowuchunii TaxID=2614638 RepID=UPI001245C89B|nr:ADP/ATP-dependent (S)-NAD(P)H-hydrate dehydratase [Microbacterium caowuchunii]QEW00560.1 NAD(P)H-hydrate dehydratase [Microbacterium caowuchunii]
MTAEWDAERTRRSLHAPTAHDDKYSRGVVGMRTGSREYPGAAVLGVEAAWRTGTGMVRYLGPERATGLVLARRPETVAAPGRVQAWVIGSGTDAATRTPEEAAALRAILAGDVPVVVDAGALDLAAEATAPLILTPHARELDRLRDALGLAPLGADDGEELRAEAARETAAVLGAVVLAKGALTLVADPSGAVRRVRTDAPWLATAGTGDVLGGVLGAIVAGRAARGTPDPAALADAAASASWLHGAAARLAAARLGERGGPITALDVAQALPRAVGEVLAGERARPCQ